MEGTCAGSLWHPAVGVGYLHRKACWMHEPRQLLHRNADQLGSTHPRSSRPAKAESTVARRCANTVFRPGMPSKTSAVMQVGMMRKISRVQCSWCTKGARTICPVGNEGVPSGLHPSTASAGSRSSSVAIFGGSSKTGHEVKC